MLRESEHLAKEGLSQLRARLGTTAVAMFAVALGATSCADQDSPNSATTTDKSRPPSASAEVRELVLPLDAYTITQPDVTLIQKAEDELTRRCMAQQGLTWTKIKRGRDDDTLPNRRRYGVAEMEVATRFGYHPPPDPESEHRTAQSDAREAALTRKERLAAYGRDGESGCRERATQELLAGIHKVDWELRDRVSADSHRRSQNDPSVIQATRSWSACMREHGFRYANPLTPGNDARWDTKSPTPAETRTAQADVQCKQRTGLVRTWWRAETALQRQAIAARAATFRLLKQAKAAYLASAQRVLAAPQSQ
ncbi:hypothetical protein ACH4FX_10985 [Streptomyces sp. NPDC018019]|uniref:hypothetical protein n=1 Tax=Streptomyces sp. NPDC018019 TaxID=3365030 RepID=UPI0037ADA792